MPTINRVDIDDILARFPELEQLDDSSFSSGIDLYIAGLGFEERANAVVKTIGSDRIAKAILVRYPSNEEENATNCEELVATLGKEKISEVVYDRATFDLVLHQTITSLMPNKGRIVVDVSALASYAIFPILDSILDNCDEHHLTVAYCESSQYFPTSREWNEAWKNVGALNDPLERQRKILESTFQSTGVGDVYTSRKHSGKNVGLLPAHAIVIPSFGLERVKAMIGVALDGFDESNVTWIIGKPPNQSKNGWRIDAMQNLYGVSGDSIHVSTRTFGEIFRAIEDTYEKFHGKKHLVIATAGSKMQHVATSIFLRMRTEVSLVLCEPKSYNTSKFSSGVGPKWRLDFGPVRELNERVQTIGMLDFKW